MKNAKTIDVGDIIIFKKRPDLKDQIITEVKDLIYFDTLKEMVETLPLSKIGFEKNSKESVLSLYRQFYDEKNENKYGIVAIKINVLNNQP